MGKNEKSSVKQLDQDTLSGFISGMSKNIGFSINSSEKDEKKRKYNPFSVENTSDVTKLYGIMKEYKEKTSGNSIIIPSSASRTPTGKKIRFEFKEELKENVFSKIVESKGLTNVTLDETNKKIEISK